MITQDGLSFQVQQSQKGALVVLDTVADMTEPVFAHPERSERIVMIPKKPSGDPNGPEKLDIF